MAKLILPSKTYLLILGRHEALEAQLDRMADRMGFRCLRTESVEEAAESLKKIKSLAGILVCSSEKEPPSLPSIPRGVLVIEPRAPIGIVLERLNAYLTVDVPEKLEHLVEFAVSQIVPKILGADFGVFSGSWDFSLRFTNLVTCDSSAEGISAKASCEVDFAQLRKTRSELSGFTDGQMTDLFGEICNQVLGVLNAGLRSIGMTPRISLPIGAELSENSSVAQVDFMPMFRFTNKQGTVAIGVALKIRPDCTARWAELSTNPVSGEIEFL